MGQHTLLYYPSYLPNPDWLKLQLLLWDSVHRIVPQAMQQQYGDECVSERLGIDPKWAPAVSPNYSDLSYFDRHRPSIEMAFRQIRATASPDYESAEALYGVHPQKAPEWVFQALFDLGLGNKEPEKHRRWTEEHYMVHPEAGKLILSCLASNVAHRRNFAPITNEESQFYLTAANEVNRTLSDRKNSSMTASLGMLVLKTLVPTNLHRLSFADVISLRDEYGDLRRAFHSVITKITDKFGLEKIIDKDQANATLEECVSEYTKEYDRFNSVTRKTIRTITDWKTQSSAASVGALGAYLAGGPLGAVIFTLGAAGFALAGMLLSDKEKSDMTKSFHYIQRLDEEMDLKRNLFAIKPLVRGVRLGE